MQMKMQTSMSKIALTFVLCMGLFFSATVTAQAAERFILVEPEGMTLFLDRQPINFDSGLEENRPDRMTVSVGTSIIFEFMDFTHAWEGSGDWVDDDLKIIERPGGGAMLTIEATVANPARFTFNTPGQYRVGLGDDTWWLRTYYITVVGDGGIQFPDASVIGEIVAETIESMSAWAREPINNAIAAGIVPQNLQSSYTQATTRAEFAALAVALYETVTGREITERASFNDTTDINVQKMGGLGVITGVGNGNFDPNGQLTREQAAVMLARLAQVMGRQITPTNLTFADNAHIASWAREAVGQMQSADIMGDAGNNHFAPQGDYTREQSIVTIMRLYDFLSTNIPVVVNTATGFSGSDDDFFNEFGIDLFDGDFEAVLDAIFDEMFRNMDLTGENFAETHVTIDDLFQISAFDNRGRPRELIISENGQAFHRWLTEFTLDLVSGITSREAQLEYIYDFIIRNFTYWDERDGHVIDGSKRPNLAQIPAMQLTLVDFSAHELSFARELLATGQGVCDHFAALFAFMAQIIGYDVRVPGGFYINRDGTRVGHAWTAIEISGEWFFFDPQIEASNLKRNRNNAGWVARQWWMQPVSASLTQSRYETRNAYNWN